MVLAGSYNGAAMHHANSGSTSRMDSAATFHTGMPTLLPQHRRIPHKPTVSCHAGFRRGIVFAASSEGMVEIKLKIEGMMCGGCSGRVEEVLQVSDRA